MAITDRELLREELQDALSTFTGCAESYGWDESDCNEAANSLLDGPLATYIALAEAERAYMAMNDDDSIWQAVTEAWENAVDALPKLDVTE